MSGEHTPEPDAHNHEETNLSVAAAPEITPTLTVQISEDLARALAPLNGSLSCDVFDVQGMLGSAVHELHDELWRISERRLLAGDADELRQIASRLNVIADAVEAVAVT